MPDRRTKLRTLSDLPDLSEAEVAQLEEENALLQFDRLTEFIDAAVEQEGSFRLTTAVVTELQAIAINGLEPAPGTFRTSGIEILGSAHNPPAPTEVPQHVVDMCEYVTIEFKAKSALHLAAYVMWRVNWIHPFSNGNGRTSRAVSYLVLCARLGSNLPGRPTIPELVAQDKRSYYRALESADEADARGTVDVSAMEDLLEELLATQLLSVIEQANDQ